MTLLNDVSNIRNQNQSTWVIFIEINYANMWVIINLYGLKAFEKLIPLRYFNVFSGLGNNIDGE